MSLTVQQTDENTADGFFQHAHAVQNTRRSHQEIVKTARLNLFIPIASSFSWFMPIRIRGEETWTCSLNWQLQ